MRAQIRLGLFLLLAQWVAACPHSALSQNTPPAAPPKPSPEVLALLDKADQAERLYHWEEALRLYDQALTKARTLQDKVGEARTLNNLGIVYYSTGQLQQALDHYQQARALYKQLGDKDGEAGTLNGLGVVYASTGQMQQALAFFEQAQTLYKQVGDKKGEASALTHLGNVSYSTGQPKQALAYHQQALPLFQQVGDKDGEAHTLNNLGIVSYSTGQMQQALAFFEQAQSLYKQVGNKAGEASTLGNLGIVSYSTGQPKQALDHYQQAQALYKQLGDKAGEARMLGNLGIVYRSTGQPKQALALFQQALPLFQQVGDKDGEANTLANLGNVYRSLGQPKQALDYYRQAQALFKQVGDKAGVASTLTYLGIVSDSAGQLQQALAFFEQAQTLYKQLGDKDGEAGTLNGLGSVYRATGQPKQARTFFEQAQSLYKQVGDKKGEANTLTNLGIVYHSTDQPKQALDHYQQARALYKQLGDKAGEARTLTNLGIVYASTGQPKQALAYYQQALLLFKQVGDKDGEADTLTNHGIVSSSTGQPQQALAYYLQAQTLYNQVGDKAGEARTLTNQALVETKRHQFTPALRHLHAAVNLLDTMQTELSGLSESQIGFQADYLFIYHRCLWLLLLQHNSQEAFALAQKTKGRALLTLMQQGKVQVRGRMTPEEQQEEEQLRLRLSALQKACVAPGVGTEADLKRYQARKELDKADQEWQRFEDKLFSLHPDLKPKRAVTTLTLKDIPSFLPADTALLEYGVLKDNYVGKDAPDETVLFCVTLERGKPRLQIYRIPVKNAVLTEKVSDFQNACAYQNAYESKARELYQLLVAPAQKQIAGKKRFLVCPDGPLWELPFQALLTGNATFLSDGYELTFAYSASGAQAAWQEKHSKERRKPTASLLVLADPDFGDDTRFDNTDPHRPIEAPSRPIEAPSRGDLFLRGEFLKRLHGARQEAEAIQRLFPDARLFLDKEAQEAVVKREAGKYRYLHFATHGLFRPSAPLLSCVALAQPPKGSEEDGFLSARELFDMDLAADLVVLSACESGKGEKKAGEGILGLTWALFVAGAPTQIVSQWSVDDASTAVLMQNFYTNLKAGQKKGTALRNAMKTLRRKPEYRHPYFWAPFVLIGDWN